MKKKKKIHLMNGFVNLDNYNSLENLHYKLKKPREIKNGNWASRIAFFLDDKLLYHSIGTYANQLPPYENFNVVYYSRDGELVLFFEIILNQLHDIVLIDIGSDKPKCYRKSIDKNSIEVNPEVIRLKFKWDDTDTLRLYFIEELGFLETEFKKDRISNTLFSRWYG